MELLRLGPIGSETPAVRMPGGEVYDLSPLTNDIDGRFLEAGGIQRARDALDAGELGLLDGAGSLRVGAPVARPGAVLCIGQNYAAHAAETGAAPPTTPILFLKPPNTVVGAFDDVLVPPGAEKVDWEVELAIVIGRRTSYLASPDESIAHIAGFAVANDVSERAYQREHSGGQWSKGKGCATFCPLGPVLVPADEVADVQSLRIWSRVNGEKRQDSSTADMIFPVAYLVWHLSQYLVLEAGDVLLTGTPEGVAMSGNFPFLRSGDIVEMGIESLGQQRQKLAPTPTP